MVDPANQARGKRNRRKGQQAALEWAKLVGGEHVGILGREDVREPHMLWEVKSSDRVPSVGQIEAALDQCEKSAVSRHLPHGVAWRLSGRPVSRRWLVVLRGPSWLDLHCAGP